MVTLSIGHVLSGRPAGLRAAINGIAAHAKEGLALASTGHQYRALPAVMGYGHEVNAHVTSGYIEAQYAKRMMRSVGARDVKFCSIRCLCIKQVAE